jgi:hypothetical protein
MKDFSQGTWLAALNQSEDEMAQIKMQIESRLKHFTSSDNTFSCLIDSQFRQAQS